jgi:hypothetical protein
MLELKNCVFEFAGIDKRVPGPDNQYRIVVIFSPIKAADYTIKVYVRNLLIGEGALTGDPNRWIAEAFAMGFMMDRFIPAPANGKES